MSAAVAEALLSTARREGEISALGEPLSRERPAVCEVVGGVEMVDRTALPWRTGRGIQKRPGSPSVHTTLPHGHGDGAGVVRVCHTGG